MQRPRRQTVKLAIDTQTGELVEAKDLLRLSEEQFTLMRRAAMTARNARRRGDADAVTLRCAICKHPLYLSRFTCVDGNRWFTHDRGAPEDCEFHEGRKLAPDTVRALIYRGQQESRQHFEMKAFLAKWLRQLSGVTRVDTEKTKFSAVVKGEWRRPDVRCVYNGIPVVFEIQLSYTFLSEVIARDEFYKREGEYIIWVFQRFDRSRAAVADDAFFNRRNLFVLDTDAQMVTEDHQMLTFSGHHQEPRLVGERIEEVWINRPVTMRDVRFPPDAGRAYYYDFHAHRRALEEQLSMQLREAAQRAWRELVDRYLQAAVAYCDSDYAQVQEQILLDIANALQEDSSWHHGFSGLSSPTFYGYHNMLAVLLSIKLDRVVGFRVKSVYQVIEAAVRTSGRDRERPHTVMYLWAYKLWQPTISEKHRAWLRNLAHEVRDSLDAGESKYRRYEGLDETVGLLFPDLELKLCSPWGTDRHSMFPEWQRSERELVTARGRSSDEGASKSAKRI